MSTSVVSPLVCICIPCFNNFETIAQTLQSIVSQNYPNIIIKVFDNASTDKTVSVIEAFIERGVAIELITRPENIGAERNFNDCISNAEGEFCAIFHADDIYHSEIISQEVAFLLRNISCGAVSTHARLIDSDGLDLGSKYLPDEVCTHAEHVFSLETLLELTYRYQNFITCPSVLFRTDVLKNTVATFRSDLFNSSSDLDVWLRIAEAGAMGLINKPLISYRLSSASFTFSRASKRVEDADMFLVLAHYLAHPALSAEQKKMLKGYYDFWLLRDRASTNLNRLILGVQPFQAMPLGQNFKIALTSFFHLRTFALSLGVKILISTPKASVLGSTLKYLRYGR